MKALKTIICFVALTGLAAIAVAQELPINNGPFKPTEESLKNYRYPEWFQDAKFGIWAHWGPQAVPRQGDWYAKKMYEENSDVYKYHLAHYGHPSKFGYKDIIPLWKAQNWDPEKLMKLYKRAGAKYFVSMASHHDNFFLWNSKINRWNAVQMGPKKDVVGLWQEAAKKQGLKFGLSEHLAASYTWFQTAHLADTSGLYKGIPYDGNDPANQDLYHSKAAPDDRQWLTNNPEYYKKYFNNVKELVDTYHPDLLYSDSQLPFGEIGRSMLANFYNGNKAFHKGEMTAVYTCKQPSQGMWAQDLERGVQDSISPYPWQTDTSIGDWYYRTGQRYKSATDIIQMLTDIVSKNGNLLINIVQTPEGDLEPDMLATLDKIGTWIDVNGEGIYGSRPWKIYGEGPSTIKANQKKGHFGGLSDESKFTATDIRFTTKGKQLYAFLLDVPSKSIKITSLGKAAKITNQKIKSVSILGLKQVVKWKQENDALVIVMPEKLPDWKVLGIKVELN
ncbi:alpha-L-fucosidase [Pedobacter sp. JCM 36344]|uniref:alpha-L-fucosidase n=1 Tax=Pedobacter sp. JCM 36344 TaxID=3374280 RepID=UPI00397AF0DF